MWEFNNSWNNLIFKLKRSIRDSLVYWKKLSLLLIKIREPCEKQEVLKRICKKNSKIILNRELQKMRKTLNLKIMV